MDGVTVALLCVAIATLLVAKYFYVPRRQRDLLEKIPGPPLKPVIGTFLGNLLDMYRPTQAEFFKSNQAMNRKYAAEGGIVRFWIGPYGFVRITRAETAAVILKNNKHIEKSKDYDFIRPWLCEGLITSSGEKWFKRRRLSDACFHFKILNDSAPIISEQSAILCSLLEEKADGKTVFDFATYMSVYGLDVIGEMAMGKKLHAQTTGKASDYVTSVFWMVTIMMKRMKSPWLWSDFIFHLTADGKRTQRVCLFARIYNEVPVIHERSEALQLEIKANAAGADEESLFAGKRKAFLDILLMAKKDGQPLSLEDIREEVDTFLFAGHDTTAVGISWNMYTIGRNPDVQKKIQEELHSIFGTYRACKMNYLERVMKETLRLYPSVPAVSRMLDSDETIGGYLVPKGTTVQMAQYTIQHSPNEYPDPERFDPDRFLPENAVGRHPYAFLPFSAGPRNCIGQKFALLEEKGTLSSLLRRFHVNAVVPENELVLIPEVTLRCEGGIRVILTKRRTADATVDG
ncbi:PREDICTED: LOW QUALITY PROTEIN: cytochrome P450 4C1-like [Priapulus caudatus]|uniref:LOW QUALITY PROTEIN: cytochrome P450 4C1-like n=1 Tax=Priapulus caudatus TaxID=37621 RepID=A0ABM1EWM3_PRICU|nr:PREDICTED: LOW QUALITY PROTEIN: cytochrome P450 4C1-like [Priapulus caudatus]